jgi:DNA replication and repair protein RecF
LRLESLEFRRFRNLRDQILSFPSRVTVLAGRNGQGKTSVLEAITLLAFGKSFRTASLRDLVSWKDERTAVSLFVRASCEGDAGRFEIAYELLKEGRRVSINGKPISSATEFFGRVKAVEFSPDDLLIVKDAPAVRRQFLDRSIATVDPVSVPALVRYQRALKQRNALLAAARRRGERTATPALERELMSWAEVLVESGREITARREKFVSKIQPYFEEMYHQLAAPESGGREERVSLKYLASFPDAAEPMLERYVESIPGDLRQGATQIGPHRDDLSLMVDFGLAPREARRFASQGQIRSIVLALKFAAYELIREMTGQLPVLLLDDVDSELDVVRKDALLERIVALEGQVILTTTDEAIAERGIFRELTVLRIRDGEVVGV